MEPIQLIGVILAGGLGISGIFKFSSEKSRKTGNLKPELVEGWRFFIGKDRTLTRSVLES